MSGNDHFWIDGVPLERGLLEMSPYSETFLFGWGLFETIAVVNGSVRFWDYHLDRLLAGASDLGFTPPDRGDLTYEVSTLLRQARIATGRMKLLLFHDGVSEIPRRLLQVSDLPATNETAVQLVLTDILRTVPATGIRRKTTSYIDELMVQRRAGELGAFDGIMLSRDGFIAEGGRSNLFFLRDERILTPPESCGLLPGVGRRGILEGAGRCGIRVDEQSLHVDELSSAEGMVAVNAMRGPMPVIRILSSTGETITEYGTGSRRLAEMLRVPFDAAAATSSLSLDD